MSFASLVSPVAARRLRTCLRAAGWRAGMVLAALLLLPASIAPVYRFPEPAPFAGDQWHNPYAGLEAAAWRTINLHAHTAAWGGVTHGVGTAGEVRRAYRRLGYDAVAISNYHQRSADGAPGALSVYEHGMNVPKAHVLVLGAREVHWLDSPVVQTVHHQQWVLDHLRGAGALLAIPHPGVRRARDAVALRALTGYQLMEVTSTYGNWEREWDQALGAGRLVWGLGNDDAHDVRDPLQVGESWTSVASGSVAPESLLAALAEGRHVAVSGHRGHSPLRVRSVAMHDGVLRVRVDGPVTEMSFMGPGGRVRHRVASGVGSYRPSQDDAYVRVVVRGDSTVLYLNPIVRHRGTGVPTQAATVDAQATRLLRTVQGATLLTLHGGVRRLAQHMGRRVVGSGLRWALAIGLRALAAAWVALAAARRRRTGQRGAEKASRGGGVQPVTR